MKLYKFDIQNCSHVVCSVSFFVDILIASQKVRENYNLRAGSTAGEKVEIIIIFIPLHFLVESFVLCWLGIQQWIMGWFLGLEIRYFCGSVLGCGRNSQVISPLSVHRPSVAHRT